MSKGVPTPLYLPYYLGFRREVTLSLSNLSVILSGRAEQLCAPLYTTFNTFEEYCCKRYFLRSDSHRIEPRASSRLSVYPRVGSVHDRGRVVVYPG